MPLPPPSRPSTPSPAPAPKPIPFDKTAPWRVPPDAAEPSDLKPGWTQAHPGYQLATPSVDPLAFPPARPVEPRLHGKTEAEWSNHCMNICGSRCCQYVAYEITPPRRLTDFERIRWALLHPLIAFFRDQSGWFLLVFSRCSKLLPNNGCAIYETRPTICQEHVPWSCENPNGLTFRALLDSDAALQRYLDRRFRRKGPWPELPAHQRTSLVIWPIATPTRAVDFDEMRWAVLHRHVAFYVENAEWFIVIDSPTEPEKRQRWLEATRPTMEAWIETQEQLREYQVRHLRAGPAARYQRHVRMNNA